MSLPPKNDDDSSSSSAPKAVKRPRGRPRKVKSKDTEATLPLVESAPVRSESEPSRERAESRAPERQPEPERAPERAPEPEERREPAARDDAGDRPTFVPDTRGEASQGQPAAPQRGEGEGSGNGHGQGGQQAPQQQGGERGEWQDRNAWKRNKRKRGRHGGGNWQPGPGGGGGGPQHQHHPKYPPQPPPPSAPQIVGDVPPVTRFSDLVALDQLASDISSGGGEPLYLCDLYALTIAELVQTARSHGIKVEGAPSRKQLLGDILQAAATAKRPIRDRGYVDVTDRGAFIVHEKMNYRLYPDDAFLPDSLIRRYGLKRGHQVEVLVQAALEGERCPSVVRIDSVMGKEPGAILQVTPFEELIPYYPLQRILLEASEIQKDVSMRAVDILTPVGFGQRGLIVAPPRTGKTVLLQNIANSITENSPFAKLILLLIDERPEEVTDFRRHTKGEVVSSTFDESPESHVHCAEMVGEKARRLVEQGEHVVILLDSITRLARAYNALASNSGKIMSGGMEATALQKPKRFFGAARNIEGGGSLTILASALIDTGSRMDEVIFEEFKGTGNMELHLDRGLVERRIFPAINIDRSGTRKEELIYHPEELQRIYGLRRAMQGLGPIESMEMLIQRLKKTKSNAEFLLTLSRQ